MTAIFHAYAIAADVWLALTLACAALILWLCRKPKPIYERDESVPAPVLYEVPIWGPIDDDEAVREAEAICITAATDEQTGDL